MTAGNVVRLPSAARRRVDNNRFADQRRAAQAVRASDPWPGEYLHWRERAADNLAATLRSIEQSPALTVVSAILATMDQSQRRAVLEILAPGFAAGGTIERQAFAVASKHNLNFGQEMDLLRAFERLDRERR